MAQETITGITVGALQGKVGWVVHLEGGLSRSFALDVEAARQFMQSLQETILLVERQQASGPFRDGLGVGDSVGMRLLPPSEDD
jgi:hypothetical protein